MNKQRKYVYFRQLKTGRVDEMNFWEWEQIQRDRQRRQEFELIRIVDLDAIQNGTDNVTGINPTTVPIEEDPLQCPLCGLVCKTEASLKKHKDSKHG